MQGAGGLVDLVQFLDRVDRVTAAQFVIEKSGVKPLSMNRLDGHLKVPVFRDLVVIHPPVAIPYPEGAKKILDGTLPYMIQRGISARDAQEFGLFWCDSGRYKNRLMFPVYENGVLVYYQGRAMWESQERGFRKSLNPSKSEGAAVSTDVAFNLDQAKGYPRVAVCEGPIDAVHVGPDAVCVFGKKISAIQIAKLLKAGVKALDLMWDGPGPKEPMGAWPEMFQIAPTLASLFDTRLVFVPRGDPGSWDRNANAYFRSVGRPVSAYSSTARL
jgi:hypothetical protein